MSYIECTAILACDVFKCKDDIVFNYIIPKENLDKVRKFIVHTENTEKIKHIRNKGKKGAKIQLVFEKLTNKINLISYSWLSDA